ncbi:MAG TPA: valine--tRNA ligase [Ignavibacteria bacterium]|nr:valine--tRNA ligase [Ignavibacteria bacterium]
MREFPSKYEPVSIEEKWRQIWEADGIYKSSVNSEKKKYSVVIPPPNVTGMLHIGHILNNTIQDIYCRWKRMAGFEVCWVPGMDHAGIATQIKVEQELKKNEGKSKYDLGREEFVKLIWDWKEKYGGIILKQLRKLGVSVDWSRERFTLDKGLSRAVREVFVDLYKKGYIYKGKRIINWDNITQTALSDDEISYIEKRDKLYYVKYPIADSNDALVIATTRPETMLGDTAVAVNPADKRYSHLAGKKVILPVVDKEIPIVFDSYVDMSFGTGALKITPAHDMNDFEVGQRHNLEAINILTKDGKINENGLQYKGQGINESRKNVLKYLKENGYLIKEEDYTHNVAVSERSGAVIEPFLSDQWFVSMKKLSEPAIQVVKEGKVRFHPDKWTKTYFHWMDNVKDWCISRQLWWGHQIPIWYHNETGEIYCETTPPKDIENWTQDPDVLDTWFSSWLWPFSVFGWENSAKDKENKDLNYYYPTDFLSTAPEIIFLWVARMIISGLEYMNDIPFKDVYFHSTVRDGKGRKMSKSLGNSPDPLVLMDQYGTDALRFTIVYLAPLGSDVLFDEKNTEIGRNFITKLWNAGRFLKMNYDRIMNDDASGDEEPEYDFAEKWIDSRFNDTIRDIEFYLNAYRLNDYTKSLYAFVWSDFCDWYIELTKVKLSKHPSTSRKAIKRAMDIYENILKLLHPVIPYVTEEIWHILDEGREGRTISKIEFPALDETKYDENSEKLFEIFKDLVTTSRNERAKYAGINDYEYDIRIKPLNTTAADSVNELTDSLHMLINNKGGTAIEHSTDEFAGTSGDYFAVKFDFKGAAPNMKNGDAGVKVTKELESLKGYITGIEKKLGNKNFLEKAAADVIEKERQKLKDAKEKYEKVSKMV